MFRRKDGAVERVARILVDLAALLVASNLAFDLRYHLDWGAFLDPGPAPWGALYQAIPYLLFGFFLIYATFGLYRSQLSRREELAMLIKAQGLAFVLIFAAAFFYRGFSYSRGAALFLMPLAFLLTLGGRFMLRIGTGALLRLDRVREKVILLGFGEETGRLIEGLARPDEAYALLGIVLRAGREAPEDIPRLGDLADLEDLLAEHRPDRVLLISGDLRHAELIAAIDTCLAQNTPWAVVPDLYDMLRDRLMMDQVAGVPVMGPHGNSIVGLNRVLKRAVDLSVAILLLLVLGPIMLLVALTVKLSSKGPVLFRQERVGRLGAAFSLLKFRTMRADADDSLHKQVMEKVIDEGQAGDTDGGQAIYKLKDDPRITPTGRWLRRFSLDELPQLFNVLSGSMSLVGPRPAIAYEVERYGQRHRRRLEALPGITGLWQVSGRNRLSFEKMVELDIHYLENWSLGLDLRICAKTVTAVLFSRGY
ncbi:MAG: sugar transferase [Deltaproteobacteria bacterium]|nr:sugar transferase [Deltaproteobacteria bacterium]